MEPKRLWLKGITACLFLLIQAGVVSAGVPRKEDIPKDFSEIELVDKTPMFQTTPEQEKNGYIIFKRPTVEIVYEAVIPREDEVVSELNGFATPGEYDPVTFCVRTLKELKGVAVKVTDLKNENGKVIPVNNIEVGAVRSFYRRAAENGKAYYNLPSIIEKRPAVDIPANTSFRFWLTIKVPDDAPAGIYTGKVSFTPANAPASELSLKFRVLPFKLAPVPPDKMFGFCYQDDYQHSFRSAHFKDMREYGATTVWVGWVSCLTQDRNDSRFRNVEYDGNKVTLHFDGTSWFEQCMEEYKKNQYPAPVIFGMWPHDVEKFALQYGEFGSEGFNNAYKAAVKAVSDYCKQKGWSEIYWGPMDEVGWGEKPQEDIKKCTVLLKLLKESGVKTTIDGGWDIFMNQPDVYPLIDLLNPNGYLPFKDKTATIHTQGKKVICYNYDESGYFPEAQRFTLGFLSWARGTDGACTWAYQNHGDPYDDFKSFGWNFRYPPQDGEVGGPSTGLEGFREGIDDYRYLVTLENALAELKKSTSDGDKQIVSEIEQEMDAIRTSIKMSEEMGGLSNGDGRIFGWKSTKVDFKTRKFQNEGPMKWKNGWDLNDYDRTRWKVAQMIMRAKNLPVESDTAKKKARLIERSPLVLNRVTLPKTEPYSPVITRQIINLPVVSQAPEIDGRLDEKVWKTALKIGDFQVRTGAEDNFASKAAAQQTEVYLLGDNQNMYVGYRCEEKDMAGLKLKVYKNKDPETWRDDCAEIFIDPDFTWKNKVHLMVNANGFWNMYASPSDLKVKAKGSRGQDYWMLEMAIPIKELKEKYGPRWGINFARERQSRDEALQDCEMSSWSYGVFGYNPDKFNIINFERSFLKRAAIEKALLGENSIILTLANPKKGKTALTVQATLIADKDSVTIPPLPVTLNGGQEKKVELPFTLLAPGNYTFTASVADNLTGKAVDEIAYAVIFKEVLQVQALNNKQYLNENRSYLEMSVFATPPMLKGSILKMSLRGPKNEVLREAALPAKAEPAGYTLNTGGLPAGRYEIKIELLKDNKVLAQRSLPLDKIAGPMD
ncbi:MAG: glycoside hydrolase domain-containing protein [Candidatus Omnitrophota bacterium]